MNENLPLTASHWGAYRVAVDDGRVTALHPFELDPAPSPIGDGITDVLDGPTRVTSPMIRRGWLDRPAGDDRATTTGADHRRGRGREPFVAVSWDEAERLVAAELDRVRTEHGNQAIFAGTYGWASAGRFHHANGQLKRFMNCLGGFTRSVNSYSVAAAEVVVPHVLGGYREFVHGAIGWSSIAEHCDLVLAIGGVPLKNGQISQGGLGRHSQRQGLTSAIEAGVSFVNVSPLRHDLDVGPEVQWLPIRPSTDTALLLALCHTLIEADLVDHAFVDRYTVGFDRFASYLAGERDGVAKSAAWASAICDVPPAEIEDLARRLTEGRSLISASWSLTRQQHGEQPFWAAIALAALIGDIGLPGGGVAFGLSATNSVGTAYSRVPAAALPQGLNPVEDFIPVARIADMLLGPGQGFEYDGGHYTYPDIELVYWAGGNPFHHHQDLNRLVEAWQRPETIVVNEWCWTATARHADIVLPCTTTLEREDVALTDRDAFLTFMPRIIDPIGEARDDFAIFTGLARRLGVEHEFTEGLDTSGWIERLYDETRKAATDAGFDIPPLAELRDRGYHELPPPEHPPVILDAFRADPVANPLRTPSGRIELFSETIDGFGYEDCPGHPTWLEPTEWLGGATGADGVDGAAGMLHLVSNQPSTKLHSQLDHGSVSRAAKPGGREPLLMHPADATRRGLTSGDVVLVRNERGALLASLVVDDGIKPGVVQMSTGAWYDPSDPGQPTNVCKHGNANVVTGDVGTSRLAQGSTAHTCLVEVAAFDGEPPPVTAFEPPPIESVGPQPGQ